MWHNLTADAAVPHVATKSLASGISILLTTGYTGRYVPMSVACLSVQSATAASSVATTVTLILAIQRQICVAADGQ